MNETFMGGLDADWWQAIGTLAAVVVALGAAGFAASSARSAKRANATAKDALDFQKRVDARGSELRDVTWQGTHESDNGVGVFRLENTGSTPAHNVQLLINSPMRSLHRFGKIGPRQVVRVNTGEWSTGRLPGERDSWEIRWASPLGEAGTFVDLGSRGELPSSAQ